MRPYRNPFALLALAIALLVPVIAQVPNTLRHSINAPSEHQPSGEYFGFAVAVDGDLAVVGIPYHSDDENALSGRVKIFKNTCELHCVLANPSPGFTDEFGWAVGISGARVVVGAPGDYIGGSDAGSAYVYDLNSATPTVPIAILNNPSPASGDYFGYSVGISGSRVVVGAWKDNTGANDAGSAYVYDVNSGTPSVPIATLNNPSPAVEDAFALCVAISGNRVVVGCPGKDVGASNAGIAYVYDVGNGTPTIPTVTLSSPNPAEDGNLGYSVGISGTRVIVGSVGEDTGAINAGVAYVYDVGSEIPSLPAFTLNNPTPALNDSFGRAVSISGMHAIVGVRFDDTGATDAGSAYVYDLGSATPVVPLATLNNPIPDTFDFFGRSVSISGTRVVVGAYADNTLASDAGDAYLYDLSGGTPTLATVSLNYPRSGEYNYFGYGVAISGAYMVVGAYGDDTWTTDAGRVHVYDLSSATPATPAFTMTNPSPASGDNFGSAVAISGTMMVVGEYREGSVHPASGAVYVYDLSSATPTVPVTKLKKPDPATADFFGRSVAISGSRIVVGVAADDTGAMNAGSAYVFDMKTGTPTVPVAILNNPTPAAGDQFGTSVAISGTRVVIGAPYDDIGISDVGTAFVYDIGGGTPAAPLATLNNPSPAQGDNFGASVAISGTRVILGSLADNGNTGGAYVYDLNSVTPTVPVLTLNNPAAGQNSSFGGAVAISGNRFVVAAFRALSTALEAGAVYVYDINSETSNVPVATLNNPSPNANDCFGWSVAIDGTTIAIGAPYDDTVAIDRGYAYAYAPANPDFDGDGLLDVWEYARFGSTSSRSALDDADIDGHVELLELAFNSNPLLPNASVIPAPVLADGYLTLTIAKRAGANYLVQSSGSLADSDFSATTTTVLQNDAAVLKVRDNLPAATPSSRFMRVKVTAAQ